MLDWACSIILLTQVPYHTRAYAVAFRCYKIVIEVAELGAVGELFERWCAHFSGIGRFRFWMAAVLLALTGGLAYAILPGAPSRAHLVAIWIERWETAALATAMLLGRWFLVQFMNEGVCPPMRPNVSAHARILTAFLGFSAICSGLALAAQYGIGMRQVNVAMLVGDFLFFIAWIFWLRRDGETVPADGPLDLGLQRRLLEYINHPWRQGTEAE